MGKVFLVDVMRLPTVLMAMDHEVEDVADNIDILEGSLLWFFTAD